MSASDLTPRELADALASQPENKEVLDALASLVESIRARAAKDLAYGFSDDYGLFIRKMFLLSAQSYGARVQNYYAQRFNLKKVAAAEGKGDLLDGDGRYFEFKFSFASRAKRKLDIVQVRLHQPIYGYIVLGSDAAAGFAPLVFQLTKQQMIEECELLGATSAHGTKEAVKGNRTTELRFSLSVDSGDAIARWKARYLHADHASIFEREK